jgi:hypothetical protein
MKRYRQRVDDLLQLLSTMEVSWQDDHSRAVVRTLGMLPERRAYSQEDINQLLETDFTVGLTIIRLALDLSKDEFQLQVRALLGSGGVSVERFQSAPGPFVDALVTMGTLKSLQALTTRTVTWRDVLIERLKMGRGSAIKGQVRGRHRECSLDVRWRQRPWAMSSWVCSHSPRCRSARDSGKSMPPSPWRSG